MKWWMYWFYILFLTKIKNTFSRPVLQTNECRGRDYYRTLDASDHHCGKRGLISSDVGQQLTAMIELVRDVMHFDIAVDDDFSDGRWRLNRANSWYYTDPAVIGAETWSAGQKRVSTALCSPPTLGRLPLASCIRLRLTSVFLTLL